MAEEPQNYEKGKMYELNMTELVPDTTQPRKYFDEEALFELKASIEKHGVLQPVLVRCAENGGFLVVSGERRYQASLLAGRDTIPAIITDGDPMEISIVENLLRENLTAIEEAEAIEQLKSTHNYKLNELSGTLGKAVSTLSEILSLNRLPEAVKNDCRNNPKAARSVLAAIAKQGSVRAMNALYKRYKASGLTRGELRAKTQAQKGADSAVDLAFVAKCASRIGTLDCSQLDHPRVVALTSDLEKLRSAASKLVKTLKAATATS